MAGTHFPEWISFGSRLISRGLADTADPEQDVPIPLELLMAWRHPDFTP
jgi:hypothetical protein